MANQDYGGAQAWFEEQDVFSTSSAALFDHMAGDEVKVYSSAMYVIKQCFESNSIEGAISVERKICLAMLSQSYQQLVSCWVDLRSGRLASAANQWRSISEAPDFILASAEDVNFAREWASSARSKTLTPARARRIAKRRLNKGGDGDGDAWASQRSKTARMYQPYSHFTSSAAGLTVLKPDEDSGGYFVAPQGAYSPQIREAAKHTALLAVDVATIASLALEDLMPEDWHQEVHTAVTDGHRILKREGAYTR